MTERAVVCSKISVGERSTFIIAPIDDANDTAATDVMPACMSGVSAVRLPDRVGEEIDDNSMRRERDNADDVMLRNVRCRYANEAR